MEHSYLSWYWRVIQNLEKNWLMVWKMTWGIRQVLTRALESIKNWDFDGMILLSKVEIVWAWNLQRRYVSWQWRMIQKLKRNWLIVLRLTWEIWRILTQALESLKTLCFNGLLLTKVYIMLELKKDRGVIFHDTLKSNARFEKKLTCSLKNEMKNLANFH